MITSKKEENLEALLVKACNTTIQMGLDEQMSPETVAQVCLASVCAVLSSVKIDQSVGRSMAKRVGRKALLDMYQAYACRIADRFDIGIEAHELV